MTYIVITPLKNEEKFFHFIAESMTSQIFKPKKWIVVDDGSTDKSAELIKEYCQKYDWIIYLNNNDNGEKRSFGSKVVRAFNLGMKSIECEDYDFIVKLDADLTLPNDYFKNISTAFIEDSNLGITGGILFYENELELKNKIKKDQFVEGPIKSIRKKCFEDIGGFWEINGWDGIDQHLARYNGWKVKNLLIPVKHHRITAKEYLSLNFYFQNGMSSYVLGNNLFLTIIRVIVRIKKKPFGLCASWFLFGFIYAKLTKKRMVNKNLSKFIRKYNYLRIKNELLCLRWH